MQTRTTKIVGLGLITLITYWLGWALFPFPPSNHVRAQVRELENPDGKVIPIGKDGIEVLTHGPVHESFAQPGAVKVDATVLIRKQPPNPLPELPPDQKPEGAHVIWIPGYWAWDDDRSDFLWVSGSWRAVPPDRDWVPGYWTEESGGWRYVSGYWAIHNETSVEIVPEPPEPIAEAPPPEQADATYVPGIWVYRQSRYWWRPGFWLANRPGWIWAPASYTWTPAGYVFVDGYWDYEWQQRGVLFAPAYISPQYQSGWYYRPAYAVDSGLLFTSLFVRGPWNHYYFGDYYDTRYARLGYTPWTDYRWGGGWYDPYWSYYRWRNRSDPRWETDVRQTYVTRRQDVAARPPRTLAEQQQRATVKGTAATALVMPLDKLPATTVKLRPVSQTESVQVRKAAIQVQNLSQQRAKIEKSAKVKTAGQAQTPVKIELPRAAAAVARPADHVAPPAPTVPKVQDAPPPKAKKTPAAKPPDEEFKSPPPAKKPPEKKPPEEVKPPPAKKPPDEFKPPPASKKPPDDERKLPPKAEPPPKAEKKSDSKKEEKDKKDKGDGGAAGLGRRTPPEMMPGELTAILMRSTPRERGHTPLNYPNRLALPLRGVDG